jgi:putative glutamine amidotransferase
MHMQNTSISRPPLIGITAFSQINPSSPASPWTSLRSAANQQYVDAVAAAGGAPVIVPMGLGEDALRRIYSGLDGLLLPGGDDVAPQRYGHQPHPNLGRVDELRDDLEITMASWALRDRLPTLGICRGIQVLAVAAGGTLYQDLPSQLQNVLLHNVVEHGRDHLAHALIVEPNSRLAAILGPGSVLVNTFHHQAVLDIPPGFTITARAPDGVVEAIESEGPDFLVGIQCHPEGIWQSTAPQFARLFQAFVEAAADRAAAAV